MLRKRSRCPAQGAAVAGRPKAERLQQPVRAHHLHALCAFCRDRRCRSYNGRNPVNALRSQSEAGLARRRRSGSTRHAAARRSAFTALSALRRRFRCHRWLPMGHSRATRDSSGATMRAELAPTCCSTAIGFDAERANAKSFFRVRQALPGRDDDAVQRLLSTELDSRARSMSTSLAARGNRGRSPLVAGLLGVIAVIAGSISPRSASCRARRL